LLLKRFRVFVHRFIHATRDWPPVQSIGAVRRSDMTEEQKAEMKVQTISRSTGVELASSNGREKLGLL
jgi:hypothetical protein